MDKGGGFSFLSPPSSSFIIFALVLQLSQRTRAESLATEAN